MGWRCRGVRKVLTREPLTPPCSRCWCLQEHYPNDAQWPEPELKAVDTVRLHVKGLVIVVRMACYGRLRAGEEGGWTVADE